MRPIDVYSKLCPNCKEDTISKPTDPVIDTYTCILDVRRMGLEGCYKRHQKDCDLLKEL